MRIGELSRRSGLPASAIRYYDRLGLLRGVVRRAGQRRFEEAAVAQLAVIRLAREAGFSLTEVRHLVDQFPRHRWRKLAAAKQADIARRIRRLSAMAGVLDGLLRCNCFDLEECGRRLSRHGLLGAPRGKRKPRRPEAPGARPS